MGKWLVLIIIIWFIFWVLRSIRKFKAQMNHDLSDQVEDMVQCQYCKIHLPKKEAISDDNQFYCCHEHHKLHSQSIS